MTTVTIGFKAGSAIGTLYWLGFGLYTCSRSYSWNKSALNADDSIKVFKSSKLSLMMTDSFLF